MFWNCFVVLKIHLTLVFCFIQNQGFEEHLKSMKSYERPTNFDAYCNKIPKDAIYLKLVMGTVVDYYKPVSNISQSDDSYCQMLWSD